MTTNTAVLVCRTILEQSVPFAHVRSSGVAPGTPPTPPPRIDRSRLLTIRRSPRGRTRPSRCRFVTWRTAPARRRCPAGCFICCNMATTATTATTTTPAVAACDAFGGAAMTPGRTTHPRVRNRAVDGVVSAMRRPQSCRLFPCVERAFEGRPRRRHRRDVAHHVGTPIV